MLTNSCKMKTVNSKGNEIKRPQFHLYFLPRCVSISIGTSLA